MLTISMPSITCCPICYCPALTHLKSGNLQDNRTRVRTYDYRCWDNNHQFSSDLVFELTMRNGELYGCKARNARLKLYPLPKPIGFNCVQQTDAYGMTYWTTPKQPMQIQVKPQVKSTVRNYMHVYSCLKL